MKKVKINLVIDGEIEDDSELTAAKIAELAPDCFVNYSLVSMYCDYFYIDDVTATCEVEE